MEKYYIPRALLKELIENPIRSVYAPGRVLEYTCSKTGEKIQLCANEDRVNEEITDDKRTTDRTAEISTGEDSGRLL